MTISDQIKNICKEKLKKHYIAELLMISRPTLDSKLKSNNFSKEEIDVLVQHGIVDKKLSDTPKR